MSQKDQTDTKKLICFSLWGTHEFYNYGALENALIAKHVYPGWICRFYYLENGCDMRIINELKKLDNVELIEMKGTDTNNNMFWRFEPAFNEENVIMISRDTDSRLNEREKAAVDEWLNSDKDFHIMRDHQYHTAHILGGMWGSRNNILLPLKNQFDQFIKNGNRGADQDFLQQFVYPFIKNNMIVHASHYRIEENCINMPNIQIDGKFIGAYMRSAPMTFNILKESERLVNVRFAYQDMS